jgi:hypothetical protein
MRLLMIGTALTLCALAANGFVALAGTATDISGDWTLTMDPDFKGNRAVVECRFRQDGYRLLVQCGGGAELAGTVKAGRVAWGAAPPTGERYPTAAWTGTVHQSGASIQGTWHLSIVGGDLDGKFSAKKKRSANDRHR